MNVPTPPKENTMSHTDSVAQAFDTIHEAMRRLRSENLDLRKQVHQATAAAELARKERDDLKDHNTRLLAVCKRQGAAA